jgi:NAD(P)-dependent dehydrogenase (short-subunit alcohol dehydrogenase family)
MTALDGKTIVLTGASAGIGAAAAKTFASAGANLIAVGRSASKLEAVADEIAQAGAPRPTLVTGDFSKLADVRSVAAQVAALTDRVDVLANNAGGVWPDRVLTVDGHETTFQVNHLAPFLLTALLRPQLEAAGDACVIATASEGHRVGKLRLDDLDWADRRYRALRVYGTSKLENILFARELPRRWTGAGVRSYAFHPGTVASEFARDNPILGLPYRTFLKGTLKTVEQGADTLIHLAEAPAAELQDGAYYFKRKVKSTAKHASDENARELWDRTAAMLELPA